MNRFRLTCIGLTVLLGVTLLFSGGCKSAPVPEPEPMPKAAELLPLDYSSVLDENGFFSGVTASDYVNLPEYKGILIPETVLTATEKDIDLQINEICKTYSMTEQLREGTVKDGDTLNIDYVGSIDGIPFDGGSTQGNGTTVTIGTTSYIDGFLDQLIGHHPGESFDIQVTFPDPYPNNPDLSGKDAVFSITINYLAGETIVPEISDEIAADYNCSSVQELRHIIGDWLIKQQKTAFVADLLKTATQKKDPPQSVVNYVIASDLEQYSYYASTYNMELNEFLKTFIGFETADQFIEDEEQQAEFKKGAIYFLAYQALAEAENLTVTQENVDASGYQSYAQQYGENYLKLVILEETIVPDFIFFNAADPAETQSEANDQFNVTDPAETQSEAGGQ